MRGRCRATCAQEVEALLHIMMGARLIARASKDMPSGAERHTDGICGTYVQREFSSNQSSGEKVSPIVLLLLS